MLIKDLPLKLQELATKEQVRQGNKPDVNLDLISHDDWGNFRWVDSELGSEFWEAVYEGKLEGAKEIYDWESEGDKSKAGSEVEESEFQEIATQVAKLLEYKNAKYGKSALNPIEIFNGKSKVGQRADDKVSRIKNNPTLQKNDVVDLIGYLILMCQENGWNTFDEFMD